jgi:hypothetical protein
MSIILVIVGSQSNTELHKECSENGTSFPKKCLVALFYHARVLGTMGDANAIPHGIVVASVHQACFLFVAMSHANNLLLGRIVIVPMTTPLANAMKTTKAIAIFHCFSFA